MRLTGGDDVLLSGAGGAIITVGALPLTRKWRQARQERKIQRSYERGVRGIPGVSETVPASYERTAMLERDMKAVKADLRELTVGMDYLIGRVEKLFPNGKNTNNPGDLLARWAESNGVWVEGEPETHSPVRRKADRQKIARDTSED